MRTLHQIIHFRQLTFFFSRRSIVEDVLLISGHTFLVTHGECAEANRELPAVHSWAGNLMLRQSVCLLTSAAYPPLQYSVQRVMKVRESITDSYSSFCSTCLVIGSPGQVLSTAPSAGLFTVLQDLCACQAFSITMDTSVKGNGQYEYTFLVSFYVTLTSTARS